MINNGQAGDNIRTYAEAVNFIEQVHKYGSHPGSENAARLLAFLGHPENSVKVVHVAGTNGKGSVCAFLADMLTACGYRTGLFTSPHLVDIRERIQVDRRIISQEAFLSAFQDVLKAVQALSEKGYGGITYFDYLFAAAMCYFAHEKVQYVVMETGLGGLYDSTNAVRHPVLSIITSISLDHTEHLGGTIAEIAMQKAGIIKPGVPLIYCSDEPDACMVIRQEALARSAPCLGIGRGDCMLFASGNGRLAFDFHLAGGPSSRLEVNSIALYQLENGAIAYSAAFLLLCLEDGISLNLQNSPEIHLSFDLLPTARTQILKNALADSCWEGRMEQVAPAVYVDGAHNADGIRMLLASLRLAASRPAILLFTAVKEKDMETMIQEICESGLFCRYILTTLDGPRAVPAESLKARFGQYTCLPVETRPSPEEAFAHALALRQDNEILLAAGSLYLVGAIKKYLG